MLSGAGGEQPYEPEGEQDAPQEAGAVRAPTQSVQLLQKEPQ